jgi:hypothetical protein
MSEYRDIHGIASLAREWTGLRRERAGSRRSWFFFFTSATMKEKVSPRLYFLIFTVFYTNVFILINF